MHRSAEDSTIRKYPVTPKLETLKLAGQQLDRVTSSFTLDRSSAVLQAVTIEEGKTHIEGNARAELRDWKLAGSSPVSATVSLRAADIQTLAAEAGWKPLPATGSVSAAVRVSGSLESPVVTGPVTFENLTAYGEHFAQARGGVTYTPTALELAHGEARNGAGRIILSGDYNHPASDWKDGSLRFDVATSGVDLAQPIQHVQDLESGLGGRLDLKAAGGAKIVSGVVDLTSLNGQLTVRNAALNGHSYGDLDGQRRYQAAASRSYRDGHLHMSFSFRAAANGAWKATIAARPTSRSRASPSPRCTTLLPANTSARTCPSAASSKGDATISGPAQSAFVDESGRDALHRAVERQPQCAAGGGRRRAGPGAAECPAHHIWKSPATPSTSATPTLSPRTPRWTPPAACC